MTYQQCRRLQAVYCLITHSYNEFACKLLVIYMISLLTLFGNFFLRKYRPWSRRTKASHKEL